VLVPASSLPDFVLKKGKINALTKRKSKVRVQRKFQKMQDLFFQEALCSVTAAKASCSALAQKQRSHSEN